MAVLKYSRGQIELNETILVMFFVVIIIIIGIILYFKVFQEKITETGERLSEQEASVLLASIASMPEISCSNEDCIDTSKLIPFSNLARTRNDYYKNSLGNKRIQIKSVYPKTENKICNNEDYSSFQYPENCGYWILYENNPSRKSGIKISSPVSLFYPEIDEYRIGILEIEVYE